MREISPLVRATTVMVVFVVTVVAAMFGSGVFDGMSMSETAHGALAPDAHYVAPATAAFGIWSVIYAGLFVLCVWLFFPSMGETRFVGRSWLWFLASLVLNAAWILVVRAELLWLSVLVIAALLSVLCVLLVRLQRDESLPGSAHLAWRVVMGLYAGWVTIASIANIASALVFAGVTELAPGASVWAVVLCVSAVIIAGIYVFRLPALPTAPLAIAWGLSWVSVARLGDTAPNVVVGWVAAFSAVAIVCIVAVRMIQHARWRTASAASGGGAVG